MWIFSGYIGFTQTLPRKCPPISENRAPQNKANYSNLKIAVSKQHLSGTVCVFVVTYWQCRAQCVSYGFVHGELGWHYHSCNDFGRLTFYQERQAHFWVSIWWWGVSILKALFISHIFANSDDELNQSHCRFHIGHHPTGKYRKKTCIIAWISEYLLLTIKEFKWTCNVIKDKWKLTIRTDLVHIGSTFIPLEMIIDIK